MRSGWGRHRASPQPVGPGVCVYFEIAFFANVNTARNYFLKRVSCSVTLSFLNTLLGKHRFIYLTKNDVISCKVIPYIDININIKIFQWSVNARIFPKLNIMMITYPHFLLYLKPQPTTSRYCHYLHPPPPPGIWLFHRYTSFSPNHNASLLSILVTRWEMIATVVSLNWKWKSPHCFFEGKSYARACKKCCGFIARTTRWLRPSSSLI